MVAHQVVAAALEAEVVEDMVAPQVVEVGEVAEVVEDMVVLREVEPQLKGQYTVHLLLPPLLHMVLRPVVVVEGMADLQEVEVEAAEGMADHQLDVVDLVPQVEVRFKAFKI